MSTSFSALPIISLSALSSSNPDPLSLTTLTNQLDDAFSTTGFVYLTDLPITFTHDDISALCDEFFNPEKGGLVHEEKMTLAKKTFVKDNRNTYRGYFPAQPGSDNLKEGFELGSPTTRCQLPKPGQKFNLTEPNVFHPKHTANNFRFYCETLHSELQSLSCRLLSLLAVALNKEPAFFNNYLDDSLSTLRLLHYPPLPTDGDRQEVICTPHTDSGILTLLHQDPKGGFEVQNSDGEWIAAPYVGGSLVVNIGDLMAKVSGSRWVATYHRVRAASTNGVADGAVRGRYSVPFFFEPGVGCVVKSVNGDEVIYGAHVLEKMKGWVEFQDFNGDVVD